MLLLCIDIDGSVADIRPRYAKAGRGPGRDNMIDFQAWLDKLQPPGALLQDEPIFPVLRMLRHLAGRDEVRVVYVTGRADSHRRDTERWLFLHRFPDGEVHMRSQGDERSAAEMKEEKMLLVTRGYAHVVVLDDDPGGDCEAMYRRNGWIHLKVTTCL